jgi:hypothetical protein
LKTFGVFNNYWRKLLVITKESEADEKQREAAESEKPREVAVDRLRREREEREKQLLIL